MAMRLFAIGGVLLVVLAWALAVPMSPPPFQASPDSAAGTYRAQGLVPAPSELVMSREIGHDVFEVPEADALHRAEEAAAGAGHAMPGMAMPPQEEAGHDEPAMPGMAMQPQGEAAHGMAMGQAGEAGNGEAAMPGMAMQPEGEAAHGMAVPPQKEAGHDEPAMPGMAMQPEGEAGQAEPAHREPAMPGMAMRPEAEAGHGGHGGGMGLVVLAPAMAAMATRTLEIEMAEWGFRPGNVTVAPGEVVRLVVRNAGNLPHEFMIMPQAGMAAVGYRLERADWNLLEHEALFEREIVLPGDGFEVVLRIDQPGVWMFMCMFPYHMQFGLMGMMMTEGMSMDGGMGGMKM